MIVAVPRETYPGERRVALVPASVPPLVKSGLQVRVESKAGLQAGYNGDAYADVGAEVVPDRDELIRSADVILQVRGLGANPHAGAADLEFMREGQVVIAPSDPLGNPQAVRQLAERGITLFAMELIPRITRAQSMDVLSSMATIAGYKAVLLAADRLPKMFPLMMTAAGTLTPAKVFVIGAGVAGLQAIATSKRLGAVVHGYDVRPAVKEQVESLGATFVEVPLETGGAEGAGGYAKQLGEDFYQKQRELMARTVATSDVCITTAAIPGKASPRIITAEAVGGMAPGSVIIDLAAERGGNCELTKADETVVTEGGVTILGPTNLPSEVPAHASQMLAKNLTNFLKLVVRDRQFNLNLQDEVVRETLAAYRGEVVNPQVREMLGMEPLKTPAPDAPPVDHLAAKS
jgi:H+-translocating NAD(P) transhydrogenase subunit alpha